MDEALRILGVILAGGQSRRFGRDKAEAIAIQVDDLVICGRNWRALERIENRPTSQVGPLGGLNEALAHARQEHFDAHLAMLSCRTFHGWLDYNTGACKVDEPVELYNVNSPSDLQNLLDRSEPSASE